MEVLSHNNGASARLLHSLTVGINSPLPIAWGISHPTALNGMRRLDGLQQLKAFASNGLNTPEFTTDVYTAMTWVREGYLVFGRKLYHTQGKDIVGPGRRAPRRFLRRWRESEFWVKVIPNVEQEWRMHIFNGKSIARGLKVQTGPTRRKMPVRNRKNGWTMVHNIKPPDEVREAAKKAVAAVGYLFGAVDLLLDRDGKVWVLEVNSAPGLDDYTAEAYADAISNYVDR
jgi:hypothetical protein